MVVNHVTFFFILMIYLKGSLQGAGRFPSHNSLCTLLYYVVKAGEGKRNWMSVYHGMQLWPIKLKLYSWQRQLRDLHSQFDMLTHQASDVLVSQCCFHLADLKKSHHQRVSEFHRIRSIFGTNERQWVEAQVENAKQQAILMAPKSQVSSDEEHIHLDLHSLRRKHAELAGELSNSYHKDEKLLSEVCMCSWFSSFLHLLLYPNFQNLLQKKSWILVVVIERTWMTKGSWTFYLLITLLVYFLYSLEVIPPSSPVSLALYGILVCIHTDSNGT
ncbi:uncharacterized protein LOC126622010 isoform X5 [Malus sylvestris]|uniref:uncharacterized protein LOC126622010 isoform X5 n=1 Tax=Malus sylvestris TaxID=3752 RepID=UPI0021ACD3AF|nr:uncharacterized protein LOC126622010 isoform X5 [Malus sylvestris]